MNAQQAIAHQALRWEGTPFKHQARGPMGPSGGVDCVGLLVCVGRALGLRAVDCTTYSMTESVATLEEHIAQSCVRIDDDQVEPGDVYVFKVSGQGHAGIALPDGGMIHTSRSAGAVRRVTDASAWLRRLSSCWRYVGESN